ncbi:MAG: DUF6075 family protein [Firmicutes bacterium]|nr:DUF6075 family protein [Bacillota bacterium]
MNYGEITDDCYHRALVYTIGICDDTRKRFDLMYDKEERHIIPGTINAAWQTGGSKKVTRLAFNLFTNRPATAYNGTKKGNFEECQRYSVSDIFCCEFAPYFIEAIRFRYPEYMKAWRVQGEES